ncbi:uncharacterized protein LOC142575567 isoform X1 [Dermacentor variabilis]|uniref:uncharacterized protein LOC142575567 isoform X1 n=1 Tax=Dermacentor variabilis TaxID=34621 RepID=UPI003F5AF2FA
MARLGTQFVIAEQREVAPTKKRTDDFNNANKGIISATLVSGSELLIKMEDEEAARASTEKLEAVGHTTKSVYTNVNTNRIQMVFERKELPGPSKDGTIKYGTAITVVFVCLDVDLVHKVANLVISSL